MAEIQIFFFHFLLFFIDIILLIFVKRLFLFRLRIPSWFFFYRFLFLDFFIAIQFIRRFKHFFLSISGFIWDSQSMRCNYIICRYIFCNMIAEYILFELNINFSLFCFMRKYWRMKLLNWICFFFYWWHLWIVLSNTWSFCFVSISVISAFSRSCRETWW